MNANETSTDAANPAVETFKQNWQRAPRYPSWSRTRDQAGHVQWAGLCALGASVVALAMALIGHISEGKPGLFYPVTVALLLLGLGLVVFAQLLFIRAAVERTAENQAQG